ncbi:MAG: hypothetical protein F6K22_27605 [Okeania sp. SIO2F4]|nr:hypothetical protein [Okeania sp. SIO2F4]
MDFVYDFAESFYQGIAGVMLENMVI